MSKQDCLKFCSLQTAFLTAQANLFVNCILSIAKISTDPNLGASQVSSTLHNHTASLKQGATWGKNPGQLQKHGLFCLEVVE